MVNDLVSRDIFIKKTQEEYCTNCICNSENCAHVYAVGGSVAEIRTKLCEIGTVVSIEMQ